MTRFWRWITGWRHTPDPDYDPKCRWDGPIYGRLTSCQTPGHGGHISHVM